MTGGRLDKSVPLFERWDGHFNAEGAEDSDIICGLEDEHVPKKQKKTAPKQKGKGKDKAVAFATEIFLSPPLTPTPQPQSQSSIFGTAPLVATLKQKKNVGFVFDDPSASGSGTGNGLVAH